MTTKKESTIEKKPKAAVKAPAKKAAVAKKKVVKAEVEEIAQLPVAEVTVTEAVIPAVTKPTLAGGRYSFATGRRKTAVANVRLFSGTGKILINKKPFETYFFHTSLQEQVLKPLALTGLEKDFYFTAHVNGGGINAQAQAMQHGIAQALGLLAEDIRSLLKRNSLLTRDDRKKERKKPGLRGARRAPQWAKR